MFPTRGVASNGSAKTSLEGAVRDAWMTLERFRARFENETGRWTAEETVEIQAVGETLTNLQLKVDEWPRGEARRCASREIQRVVRVSEELLSRPTFETALSQRLRRDLDLPNGVADEMEWLTWIKESYPSPLKLLEDMDKNAGFWKDMPWGWRALVHLRMRAPSHNDWWFRKPR